VLDLSVLGSSSGGLIGALPGNHASMDQLEVRKML
jgi:hypothetical protein